MIIWLGSSCPGVWCQVSKTLELSYNWLIVRIKETLESSATIDQLWDQRTTWMKSEKGFGAISDTRMTPEVDSCFNTSDSCCLWMGVGNQPHANAMSLCSIPWDLCDKLCVIILKKWWEVGGVAAATTSKPSTESCSSHDLGLQRTSPDQCFHTWAKKHLLWKTSSIAQNAQWVWCTVSWCFFCFFVFCLQFCDVAKVVIIHKSV
jgi:hypothetical protein